MAGITSIAPAIIDTRGGTEIVLTGSFAINEIVYVYIGPNGDETDEPCYGAVAGQGYAPVSLDGATLIVVTPRLDLVGGQSVSVFGPYGSDTQAITVLEHMFSDAEFEIKKSWEPNYNSGSRRIQDEPEQQ